MAPEDWIEHRRASDGELLGWTRPDGDAWVAMSILGQAISEPSDWFDAEHALDELGLGGLADVWMLDTDLGEVRVRIVHVATDGITVQTDDFGAIDAPVARFDLPWPAPAELRSPR